MKTCTSTAIILGHKNIGEKDKLVFFYTKELGKIKAIAKGARRLTSRFTGHLETLNFAKISLYFGPRNTILTEIISLKKHKELRNNLEKLSCALQVAEITDKLIYEKQEIEGLLDLLEQTLEFLTTSNKPMLVSLSYIAKLLNLLGISPDFATIDSKLEEKYRKFFHYITTRPVSEIKNIKIQSQEKSKIHQIIQLIIAQQTHLEINSLKLSQNFV